MKKIVSLLLVITFVFTLGGCFGEETEKVTPEDVKNRVISEAKEYLKENYPDDEFTYISGRSPNWAYNYYEIGFSSKNYDDQEVVVFGTSTDEIVDEKTVYSYCDTYYQYYLCDDAEKYFYDIAKEYISDEFVVKVLFGTSIGFADEVDKELNFVENYQNGNIDFFVYIFTENDTKEIEEDINGMINDFKSNDNELWIRNVITNNLSEVSKSSINTIRDDFSKYCIKEISYSTEIDNK